MKARSQVAEQPLSAAADAMKRIGAAEWWVTSGGDARRFAEHAARSLELWLREKQAAKQNVHFLPPTIEGAHWYVAARLPRKSRPADCSPDPHFVIIADDYLLLWRLIEPVTTLQATAISRRLVYRLGGRSAVGELAPMPGTVFARNARDPSGNIRVMMMPKARVPGYLADGDKLVLPSAAAVSTERGFTRVDKVEAKPMPWLWPGIIPLGEFTLLAGEPKVGKSTIAADLVARVTKGVDWPDGAKGDASGGVVMLETEDPIGVTRNRLEAAGADLRAVLADDTVRDLSAAAGIAQLEKAAAELGSLRLLVLSPVRMFFGDIEAHGQIDMRNRLEKLMTWAAARQVAVLGIAHKEAGKGGRSAEDVAGPKAIAQRARAVLTAMRDPDDPMVKTNPKAAQRILTSAGSNLGADTFSIPFETIGVNIGEIATSKVLWG